MYSSANKVEVMPPALESVEGGELFDIDSDLSPTKVEIVETPIKNPEKHKLSRRASRRARKADRAADRDNQKEYDKWKPGQTKKKAEDPVLAAAGQGCLESLERIRSDCGYLSLSVRDKHGSNALHWASGGGHIHVCEWLLELPEEVGIGGVCARNREGRQPLHWAARNGHVEQCSWLIQKGADKNALTDNLTNAMQWAVWQAHAPVVDFLLGMGCEHQLHELNSFGCSTAHWAALAGHGDMCRYLARLGVRFDIANTQGHTGLHKAAWRGHWHILHWLIYEMGFKNLIYQADEAGLLPADLASLGKHYAVADVLDRIASDKVVGEE